MLIGSALPWGLVLGKLLSASPTALMWTAWAGLVTVAAGLVPWRWIAIVSAAAGGVTAVSFAVWQTARLVGVCGLSLDCLPGPGLGLLLAGGLGALYRVAHTARDKRSG